MLTIRQSQKQALAEPRVQEFIHKTIEYVRAEYPAEFERRGEPGVEKLARRAIADAERYGLPSSVDVTGLLSLMIILGDEDFVSKPEHYRVKNILESPTVAAEEKIGMVLDEIG